MSFKCVRPSIHMVFQLRVTFTISNFVIIGKSIRNLKLLKQMCSMSLSAARNETTQFSLMWWSFEKNYSKNSSSIFIFMHDCLVELIFVRSPYILGRLKKVMVLVCPGIGNVAPSLNDNVWNACCGSVDSLCLDLFVNDQLTKKIICNCLKFSYFNPPLPVSTYLIIRHYTWE